MVGYMGCGKSTLGRKLAHRLGVSFADTDTLVEQREGASVADVYELAGAEYFRQAERAVLDELIASGACTVISTGGGLPAWGDNMARMNAVGTTVYLRRPRNGHGCVDCPTPNWSSSCGATWPSANLFTHKPD